MQLAVDVSSSVRPAVAKPRTAPFDPVVADRLLALLSTDDAFRLEFQRSPMAALASIGFSPAAGDIWFDCFFGISLASKAQIAEARDEIRSMLLSGLDQTTPKLDTGITGMVRK